MVGLDMGLTGWLEEPEELFLCYILKTTEFLGWLSLEEL
jgi:hypothetical protein